MPPGSEIPVRTKFFGIRVFPGLSITKVRQLTFIQERIQNKYLIYLSEKKESFYRRLFMLCSVRILDLK
jgi:hypothetical protein